MFGNMSVMDFRISKLHGENVISLIRPEVREGVFLDNSFRIVEDIAIDGFNMHDFNLVDNGERALIITRGVRNASEELSRVTGLEHGQCEANFLGIEEVDTKTWEPVWNWTSYERIGFDETTFKYGPAEHRCKKAWDFLHANAVDKCPDGDLVLSARHTDTIYKISKVDGSIVWRLGGLKNDFNLGNVNFSRQHDVRCRAQNETHTVISFLDNAKGEDPQTPTSSHSRGLLVALDHKNLNASLMATYNHPHGPGGYAHRRGSFQILENNHVFMGWSEHSLQTEHTPDGELILEAELLPHWLGTYRSYKFPFVGRPIDPPDVLSYSANIPEDVNRTATDVYVSWNGATEVAAWRLYKTSGTHRDATTELVATYAKTGFETLISFDGYAKYVLLEALDRDGVPLEHGRSRIITTPPPAILLTPSVAAEDLWIQQTKQAEQAELAKQIEEAEQAKQAEDAERVKQAEEAEQAKQAEQAAALAEQDELDDQEDQEEADEQLSSDQLIIITEAPGLAFLAGFLLCLLLSLLAWAIWWAGRSFWKVRTPWHQDAKQYQPLAAKEYAEVRETEVGSPV